MLEVNHLSIEMNLKYIVQDLSFILKFNDRLAIIGEEGNGKSSILKVIVGELDYGQMEGFVHTKSKLGYLKQTVLDQERTVFSYLFLNEEEYQNQISFYYQYLSSLQISDTMLYQKISELSGGERVKIQLLKLLLEDFDILILDEPTNDLDLNTLEWLEHFILTCEKPILYVSHDETLLSHTANRILHLELIQKKQHAKHTLVSTGYDAYIENRLSWIHKTTQIAKGKKRKYDKQMDKLTQIRNKVEYEQATITRADPHGGYVLKKKMKSLQSQKKEWKKRKRQRLLIMKNQFLFSLKKHPFHVKKN